ncbi:MAG: methyl-accepting chemotaxis protein, partial [bacterium]
MKSIKLTYKVIAALLLAFVLPVIILGFIAHISMSAISRKAIGESVNSLIASEQAKLQENTQSKAYEINQFFRGYYRDVELLKDYYLYVDNNYSFFNFGRIKDLYPDKPHQGLPGYGYINPEFGAYADFEQRGTGCPWLPKRTVNKLRIDADFRVHVAATLNKVMFLDHIFSQMYKKRSETMDLVWVVTDIGATNVFPPYNYYDVIRRNPSIVDKNENDEDYVRLLNPENNPDRKILWLEPYLDMFKGIWMTSCAAPLYRGDDFLGTIGMDILLKTITEKVINLKIGKEGYAFLITASGKIVAIPENKINEIIWNETLRKALHQTYLSPTDQRWQKDEIDALSTITLDQTPNDDLREIVRAMMSGATGTKQITLADVQNIISYAPMQSTGWSIGLVVPMEELLAQSNYIRLAIDRVSRDIIAKFLISALILLVISVLVGAGLHYQIIKPLTRFTSELGRISWENLEFDGESYTRNDEIGQMYSKFWEMIRIIKSARDEITDKGNALKGANEELAKAKAELEILAGELENKVEERTAELKKAEESLV